MNVKVLDLLEEVCGTNEVSQDLELNLFQSGILDAMGGIELLVEIEQQLGIKIEPIEVELTEIDTSAKIMALVESKR